MTRAKVKNHMRELVRDGHCTDTKTGEINMTCLAEVTAGELGHDDWLDDDQHFVWDVAFEVAEEAGGLGDADSPGAVTWMQIPRTAKVMLGARDAVVSEGGNTLSFKIGRNAKSINWIRIRLDPTDTYTMQFGRGLKNPRVVKTVDGVYYDQMLPVIEQYTGMRTGGIR